MVLMSCAFARFWYGFISFVLCPRLGLNLLESKGLVGYRLTFQMERKRRYWEEEIKELLTTIVLSSCIIILLLIDKRKILLQLIDEEEFVYIDIDGKDNKAIGYN